MPKTKFQQILFAAITVFLTVNAFVFYNMAIDMGGMSNKVFLAAYSVVWQECIIAFLLETLIVSKLATKLAFKFVDPKIDRPIVITLAITCMHVILMCPSMSFAATIMYNGFTYEFIANWLQKIVFNFPFAFFIQIFFIGPFVRYIFKTLFNDKRKTILKLEECKG